MHSGYMLCRRLAEEMFNTRCLPRYTRSMAMLGGATSSSKEGVWRDLALGARFARVIVPQVPLLGHLLCQVRAVHRHLAKAGVRCSSARDVLDISDPHLQTQAVCRVRLACSCCTDMMARICTGLWYSKHPTECQAARNT